MRTINTVLPLAVATALMGAGETPRQDPLVWAHYTPVASKESDFGDLKAHGIGLVNDKSNTVEEARAALAVARKTGMKYNIYLRDITKQASLVEQAGLQPAHALMTGGAYQGKA